jgi:hypothetical protein
MALLPIPALTWSQAAADSHEKSEKVGETLAALQAEPGKRIADVGGSERVGRFPVSPSPTDR